jgi:hypothetical protein
MTQNARVRHTLASLASVTLLALASRAAAEVSNIDPQQQRGPDDLALYSDIDSQLIDQGRVRDNDSVLHVGGVARTLFELDTPGSRQGLGVQLDGWFGLGEDQTQTPKIAPGEMVQFEGRVSYLYESLDQSDKPEWQVIPQYEFVTYPDAAIYQNHLKWAEHWLGSDLWWCSPIDGVEFGGGAYWDPRRDYHMFKGAMGAREFYQDAPFDLTGWELLNFGNRTFKRYFAGTGLPPPAPAGISHGGVSTFDLGGRATMPLPWEDTWTYAQADWIYWLQSSDRRFLNSVHQNVGSFVFAVGVEWRPQ